MFSETVVFTQAAVRTDPMSGEDVRDDWDNATTVLTEVCAVEPLGSDEPLQDGRQSVVIGYRLYFDHDVTIDREWRATVRGDTLEVQGRPAEWLMDTWEAGTVAEVRFTDG